MQARVRWWLISIIALVIVAFVGVTEPVKFQDRRDPDTGRDVKPLKQVGPFRFYHPHVGLTLGLDLRGGIHLVLQAQREGIFEFSAPQLAQPRNEAQQTETWERIVNLLPMDKIGAEKREVDLDQSSHITVRTRVRDRADMQRQGKIIADLLATQFPKIETKAATMQAVSGDDLKSIDRILRNRIDAFGVAEPLIQTQPPDRVIVELPGVKDPEKAKAMISKTAVLEFRGIPRKYAYGDKGPQITKVDGRDVYTFTDAGNKEVPTSQVIDQSPIVATGRKLEPSYSRVVSVPGQPTAVTFKLKGDAAKAFEDFTRANVRAYLAVILDGQMISCPIIKSTIPGEGVIEGGFDRVGGLEEARDLSILLNAGALPFDLEYVENRTISPELGEDALHKSLIAGLVGMALVLIFMVAYYRLPGLLADVALVMYCILLMGAIKMVNQVLTLPGILAVIISIGMAVDANIIIFERLKEEIRTGKTLRSAVEAAFKRAWTAILDSNVCSIGTGIVLFYFGTGPIKGFAVALIIGVAVSLFTAVTVTRLFVNMTIDSRAASNPALFGVSPTEVQRA
ncbi:MAG: protein translocase subunit SecD [Armatimonadota bacterium]|jgi:protein-export membrane protein SecD